MYTNPSPLPNRQTEATQETMTNPKADFSMYLPRLTADEIYDCLNLQYYVENGLDIAEAAKLYGRTEAYAQSILRKAAECEMLCDENGKG